MHWNTLLKKHFQLVSDFIFLSPSFCFTLCFCSCESTKDKLSLYHIWTFASRFAGVFRKSFYSLTTIGKLRAVCRGISRKFYKKIAEKFSRQQHIKRKFDYIKLPSTLFIFNCFLFFVVINSVDSAGWNSTLRRYINLLFEPDIRLNKAETICISSIFHSRRYL